VGAGEPCDWLSDPRRLPPELTASVLAAVREVWLSREVPTEASSRAQPETAAVAIDHPEPAA
jgi:hypothetical protein